MKNNLIKNINQMGQQQKNPIQISNRWPSDRLTSALTD